MDERDLSCVLALAEALHFGRAARRLNLTQPALTRRLAELERRLGTPLFERDSRGASLTSAGQAFVAEAASALRHMQAARSAATRASQGLSGTLRLGFTIVALYRRLPGLVRQFREAHPDVALKLHEMISPTQEDALLTETLDLGILHPPLERDGLAQRLLADEPLDLAIPPGHPLGGGSGPVPMGALAGVDLLLPPRVIGPNLYDRIVETCREAGFSPRVVQESAPMTTTLGLVAAGLGCAFVARGMAVVRPEGVTYRPLAREPLKLPCCLAWSEAVGLSPTALRFAEMASDL